MQRAQGCGHIRLSQIGIPLAICAGVETMVTNNPVGSPTTNLSYCVGSVVFLSADDLTQSLRDTSKNSNID